MTDTDDTQMDWEINFGDFEEKISEKDKVYAKNKIKEFELDTKNKKTFEYNKELNIVIFRSNDFRLHCNINESKKILSVYKYNPTSQHKEHEKEVKKRKNTKT